MLSFKLILYSFFNCMKKRTTDLSFSVSSGTGSEKKQIKKILNRDDLAYQKINIISTINIMHIL